MNTTRVERIKVLRFHPIIEAYGFGDPSDVARIVLENFSCSYLLTKSHHESIRTSVVRIASLQVFYIGDEERIFAVEQFLEL